MAHQPTGRLAPLLALLQQQEFNDAWQMPTRVQEQLADLRRGEAGTGWYSLTAGC